MAKAKRKGRGMFVLLCVVVFLVAFAGSVAFKLLHKPAEFARFTTEWSDEVGKVVQDLSYGEKPANTFDLYLPADSTRERYGMVVYLHAGGFSSGDKTDDAAMLQWLCSKGYVAVGINYTLFSDDNPDANVYTQSVEVRDAMPAVVAAARDAGYDVDSMAIGGGSAGGTLAMLYAYRDASTAPVPVKMLFEVVGPSSFFAEDWVSYGLDQNPEAAAGLFSVMSGASITPDMLGTPAYDEAVKPISGYAWVTPESVPTVCAYGAYDTVCPFLSARHLIGALEENGVDYRYFELPHSGHALQNDDDLYLAYMDAVVEYLDAYLPVEG